MKKVLKVLLVTFSVVVCACLTALGSLVLLAMALGVAY